MSVKVRVGVIGGGLMGREVASAFGRWFMLKDQSIVPELVAVADVDPNALDWFSRVSTVTTKTLNAGELLQDPDIDVVYVAVPHDLHKGLYLDALDKGKDLFAEKPFGIDLDSAQTIHDRAHTLGRFVRCSSEFPFYPGAQAAIDFFQKNRSEFGQLLEVNAAFLHSSDLDLDKPPNWKRIVRHCGEPGVMNDLGLHVAHVPLRLGLNPRSVYAQLQNVVKTRKTSDAKIVDCDTWDNATLQTTLEGDVPMRLEMKRLAPGETNTWKLEILGTQMGVRYSTKTPKTFWIYQKGQWMTTDLGHLSTFPTETGGIFEFGFPDALLQMWASFLQERSGSLGNKFGCATPEEAVASHVLWEAALRSHRSGRAEAVAFA